jgi:cytochrome oxidase Cu insertion factor (SCO1/SenC/PrrC family)
MLDVTTDAAPGLGGPASKDTGVSSPRPRGRGRFWITLLTAVCLVLAASAYVVVRVRQHQDSLALLRTSGIPASVPTGLSNLMGLSPVPATPAPGFTLTDQAGRTLSLASFKGRAVVLEFMDPHCTDICPLVSLEFTDAYHDLGATASHVVFVAVNVNPYHRGVSDMAAYSAEHQLDAIPSWHFFTGTPGSLRAVWNAFGIEVDAPGPAADVIHTSTVYFIDPSGRERYVASPMADYTSSGTAYLPAGILASWGHGMALVARQLAG